MTNKILFTLLALSIAVPSFAYVTTSDTYSSGFLKMNGYSDTSITMVTHERNKAAGIPNEPYNKKLIKNKFLRALYRSYIYIDPAAEGETFLNHDIKIEPVTTDL